MLHLKTRRHAIAAFFAVSVSALTLAACGSSNMSEHDMSNMDGSTTAAGAAADHNSQDVMFSQMMIVHHQEAIEMAKTAETKASDPAVKALAAKIEAAQAPEITQMEGWLKEWGESTSMSSAHSMESMPGAMSDADMQTLNNATGSAFDRQFLTMMTTHHQGAITMAKTEQSSGRYQPARDLAYNIAASQSTELTEMAEMLKRIGS